jgi:hypothetical protein
VVTPGPWEINPQGNSVRGPAGFVCSLNDVKPADARLIVAGPDLLAACEAAAQWMHDNCEDDEPLRSLRRAIAKATEAS